MPCKMTRSVLSSLSLPRSCATVEVSGESAGASSSRSPGSGDEACLTLDPSCSWRKQICEVRPNRSSTLRSSAVADDGERVAADRDDELQTVTLPRPDTAVTSPPATSKSDGESVLRPRAPGPSARPSSDCCRCRWLRAGSTTSSPMSDPGRCREPLRRKVLGMGDESERRTKYGHVWLPPPPPPPPPFSASTLSALSSTVAVSVTPSTAKDSRIRVEQTDSFGSGSGCGGSASLRSHGPEGLRSDGFSARRHLCLENVRETDKTTSAVEKTRPPRSTIDRRPVTAADQRRLATSCTLTTFV